MANRRSFFVMALMLSLAACGPGSVEGELPTSEVWEEQNPQPVEGVSFHVVLELLVADDFDGEHFEIVVDGNLVVEGVGMANPEEHCNWYGPYELTLDEGAHQISVTAGEGLSFSESFDLSTESSGYVIYQGPSWEPGFDQPTLSWSYFDGPTGCL